MTLRMNAGEFCEHARSPSLVDDLASSAGGVIVVADGSLGDLVVPPLLPVVVIAESDDDGAAPGADLVADDDVLAAALETITANPIAATTLATLLRTGEQRGVAAGLVAESAAYGALQGGEEFARWRASVPVRERTAVSAPVRLHRDGDVLHLVLDRPEVRNALDAAMRDMLAESLIVALSDPAVRVELRGNGPSFCSGGLLDEFGSRSDPASAHLIRLERNLGWLLHQLAPRTYVRVHGPCVGSGVELPAFAERVSAVAGSTFALPEVAMGLIPGAGGTVSLPLRIGRQRTARLALTGRPIDAELAFEWGLVDAIIDDG